MEADEVAVGDLVKFPSLAAVTYQVGVLIQELQRITHEEYPIQARQIRDVFLCVAEHVAEELFDLRDPAQPLAARGRAGFARMRALARIVHQIYSQIRYLRASLPGQSPPGLQVALSALTELYFPKENGKAVCLVRPQWSYNLRYVPLTWELRGIISLDVLDPEGVLSIKGSRDIIPELWKKWRTRLPDGERKDREESPREHLGILSFAGLDTYDTLLYPLLAHELGHFIDFSFEPPLHRSDPLRRSSEIKKSEVQKVVDSTEAAAIWNNLVDRTSICLREMLADVLATRMLGFAFFVAQAEFLKTVAEWQQAKITRSGYPGIKFRLSVILNHLLAEEYSGNILKFCREQEQAPQAKLLAEFVGKWKDHLSDAQATSGQSGGGTMDEQLDGLVEEAVRRALPDINAEARRVIPDEDTPRLTERLFQRILCLEHDLPPSCPDDGGSSFAEIMTASWSYQVLYGEAKEMAKSNADKRFEEYSKTCRLVLKAVELISAPPSQQSHTAGTSPSGPGPALGVLSASGIAARTALRPGNPFHLAVMPFNAEAIQAASLDVRLGNWFVAARRTRLKSVRLGNKSQEQLLMKVGREEVFIPEGGIFLLHPGDFVLGATLEFFALPADLMAFVEGKSGLGRLGLIVATATPVAPGFHGVIVLELANTGTVPLELRPGIEIAQVVFHGMAEPVPHEQLYHGKHQCQIKP